MRTRSKLYALLDSEINPSETILLEGIKGRIPKMRLIFALLAMVTILLALVMKAGLAALAIVAASVLGVMWMYRTDNSPLSILYAITDIRVLEVTTAGAKTLATRGEIDKITESPHFKEFKKVSFTSGLEPIHLYVEPQQAEMRVNERLKIYAAQTQNDSLTLLRQTDEPDQNLLESQK